MTANTLTLKDSNTTYSDKPNQKFLSPLDTTGYNDEYRNFKLFQHHNVSKLLTFHNSWIKHLWKRQVGYGVDFIFTVGSYKVYVENKYCQAKYPIRKKWFYDSVLPRFKNCHEPNHLHIHVLLTNEPENYFSVQSELQAAKIRLTTFTQLIELLHRLSTVDVYGTTIPITVNDNNEQRVTSISYSELRSAFIEFSKELKQEENKRLRELYAG